MGQNEQSFSDKVEFIMKLGAALHRYGAPAHRLEEALKGVSKDLGLKSEFFSTPTAIMSTLIGEQQEVTRIIRIEPGEVDLGKLSLVDQLGDSAVRGRIALMTCANRIDQIVAKPPYYPNWLTCLCQGLSSLGIACIFRVGLADLAWSFLVGALIGVLNLFAKKSQRLQRVFEAAAAFLAAVIASLAHYFDSSVSTTAVTLAGIIALLPGLTLTIAINELATQNLIAGTARLMGSIITLLKLVVGVALGTTAIAMITTLPSPQESPRLAEPFVWLGLMIAATAAIVVYKTHSRDRVWVFLASCTGFASAKFGTLILGPILGVFAAGVVVGALSNLFARVFKRPASIVVLPGIVLLVPGSLGYVSLTFLMRNDVVRGLDSAVNMLVLALTIVAGLLFGNVLISPKRSL